MMTKNRGNHRAGGVLLLAVLLFALCCRGSTKVSTDGETHFLTTCAPDNDDCGSTLTCVCGVCALLCTRTADCADLSAAAECISDADRTSESCDGGAAVSICDLPCSTDDQCGTLGSSYRCSQGFCRSGSDIGGGENGGAAGIPDGAGGAAGASAASGGTAACARGEVAGDKVVILGDVFVAQTREIPLALEALARDAGSLSSLETYRDYSSNTQNSFTVNNALLLNQYSAAQAESPVKVVIMDGGGSDLLLKSCDGGPTPDCQLMLDVVAGAEQLLSRMAEDGVEDVVWFFYPDPTGEELLAELDVLRPLLLEVCANSPVPCHWVDLRATFAGHFDEYMQTDFVPTPVGAEAAAATIWSSMEQNCVAQ